MTSLIHFELEQDHIGLITLDRPQVRNALNWEMMERFALLIEQISKDDQVHVLIVTGAGGAFCAGGDLIELHQFQSHADGERLAELMGDALTQLFNLSIPVIAAIEGPAIGGGAEIAMACDLKVAAQNARISFPQIKLALTPAWGGAGLLVKLLGYPRAFRLLATGETLKPKAALDLGLIHHIVPDGQALQSAIALGQDFLGHSIAAMASLKEILHAHQNLPLSEATAVERDVFASLWASDDHITKAADFVAHKD